MLKYWKLVVMLFLELCQEWSHGIVTLFCIAELLLGAMSLTFIICFVIRCVIMGFCCMWIVDIAFFSGCYDKLITSVSRWMPVTWLSVLLLHCSICAVPNLVMHHRPNRCRSDQPCLRRRISWSRRLLMNAWRTWLQMPRRFLRYHILSILLRVIIIISVIIRILLSSPPLPQAWNAWGEFSTFN